MTDTEQDILSQFAVYVRQRTEVADAPTTNVYAFRSFLNHIARHGYHELDKNLPVNWIAELFLEGRKAATVKRYVCRLRVAYQDWRKETGLQPDDDDPFAGVLGLAVPENQVNFGQPLSNLDKVRKLISTDGYLGADGKWRAILFWLLYNPGATLEDAVNLKFDTASKFCPQLAEIVESMDSSHGRRYVFGLDQPDRRTAGIAREVKIRLARLMKSAGMEFDETSVRESLRTMWICAALRSGVGIEETRALAGGIPRECRILGSVRPARLTERNRTEILSRVADSINDITTRWYVLNLRGGNTPDDVKECVGEAFPALSETIQYYYPTHCVYRQSRRKKPVRQEVPYLPGLLFIKVRSDMVRALMGRIAKVAWGYRYTRTPGSPYSVIPQRAMALFQRHLGVMSDDVRVELVETAAPLERGDRVRVMRGDLYGRLGTVETVREEAGVTYYSIRLTESTSFRITATRLSRLDLDPAR